MRTSNHEIPLILIMNRLIKLETTIFIKQVARVSNSIFDFEAADNNWSRVVQIFRVECNLCVRLFMFISKIICLIILMDVFSLKTAIVCLIHFFPKHFFK